MKGGGSSKALVNQQKQALAAQQAQATIANQNVAADPATVTSGGTADTTTAAAAPVKRNQNKRGLSSSLGLNT